MIVDSPVWLSAISYNGADSYIGGMKVYNLVRLVEGEALTEIATLSQSLLMIMKAQTCQYPLLNQVRKIIWLQYTNTIESRVLCLVVGIRMNLLCDMVQFSIE